MERTDLARLRREYGARGIEVTDFTAQPMDQFARWFAEVDTAVPKSDTPWFEVNAVVLSTATLDGAPSARTVLLKEFGSEGFTVYTNHDSRKGRELAENAAAHLLFPWYPLERQVGVVGVATPVPDAQSDAYFATRPRGAQLSAWASAQSTVIPNRAWLDERYADCDRMFPGAIPRPPNWGGYLIEPRSVEFWQGRPSRLHDRLQYVHDGAQWRIERLSP